MIQKIREMNPDPSSFENTFKLSRDKSDELAHLAVYELSKPLDVIKSRVASVPSPRLIKF